MLRARLCARPPIDRTPPVGRLRASLAPRGRTARGTMAPGAAGDALLTDRALVARRNGVACRSARSSGQQAVLDREQHRPDPGRHVELAVDVLEVAADRAFAHDERSGDVLPAPTAR